MSHIATALAPILILILLGYCLKRASFLPEDTWPGLEKLTYFILFPALLIRVLAKQSLSGAPWPAMLLVVVGTIMAAAISLVLWHRVRKGVSGATFTSIFQGGVRFNTYIALAVAQAFYGAEGLALSAVAAGFMIVLINLLCISAFSIWGKTSYSGIKPFVREIIANPLIISCAIGWFLSLTNIGLPGISDDLLGIIGRAALLLGLLAVGAALKPEAVRGHLRAISISSLIQFGLKPLVAALLIYLTGLSGVAAGVLLIALMTPTAPSAFILARQLGGDTETMSSIITFQTMLAFLVMPIMVLLLLK